MNNRILTNLKIISKIKVNDKLSLDSDKYIIINQNNLITSITRYIYSINRNLNIIQLNEIYDDISNLVDGYLCSKYFSYYDHSSNLEYEKYLDLKNIIENILKDLKESKTGLFNLKKTYSYDILIDSQVDNIINKVDNVINKINKKLNDTLKKYKNDCFTNEINIII